MNSSVDIDIEYLERKIEKKAEYVRILQSSAEKRVDPSKLYESFIKEYTEIIDDLTGLKNMLKISKNLLPRQPSTTSLLNEFSTTQNLLPRQPSTVSLLNEFNKTQNLLRRHPSTVSFSNELNKTYNQRSFIVADLPESASFEPADKRRYDLANTKKILNFLCINVEIQKCFRFTPNVFQTGRPPFVKVLLATEEEKKKVVNAADANIKNIRLLDSKFAAITIRDADKPGNNRYNSRNGSSTYSTNSSQSSRPASPKLSHASSFWNVPSSSKFVESSTTSSSSDARPMYTKGKPEDQYSSDEDW
uniref:Uncharacterized protein n=1 Tax=Panagrolaimus superbus TaxID=310955 RepID=A0A914XUZ4_9BILA